MKWIKRKYRLKKQVNEKRIIKRFLFLPKTLKHKTIWLERVEINQVVVNKDGAWKWQSQNFKSWH